MKMVTSLLVFILAIGLVAVPASAKSNESAEKKESKVLSQIQRFQQKLQKLEDRLQSLRSGQLSDNDDDDDDRLPRGLRHAPGIKKRLESGKGLPPGWQKKLGDFDRDHRGTTTPDTTAPGIVERSVNVGTSTAVIVWRTNERTIGQVRFSTTTPLTGDSQTSHSSSFSLDHRVRLHGLVPEITYYYEIVATDRAGNKATSSLSSFQTHPLVSPDVTAPEIIFATHIGLTGTSTRLIWVTSEASDSRVWLSTTTPIDTAVSPTASSTGLVFYHDILVSGLATSTQYFYTLGSRDAAGNTGFLSGNSFTTGGD